MGNYDEFEREYSDRMWRNYIGAAICIVAKQGLLYLSDLAHLSKINTPRKVIRRRRNKRRKPNE